MQHFDLAVIGSGAGLIVMEAALKHGKTVAVIEKGNFGGTCLNRGCIPSKMLVYPADLIRDAQRGERVGLHFPAPQVDWDKISRRMWRQIDANQGLQTQLENTKGLTLFLGEGQFVDDHTIKVALNAGGETTLTADRIVVAAGARTRVPEIPGLNSVDYITSESFFGDKFPKKPYDSLLIIGGGTTACEFAHIFSAFGTKVTLAVRSETILRGFDAETGPFVSRELQSLGVDVRYFAKAQSVRNEDGQAVVSFVDGQTGEKYEIKAQTLMLASGILPNTDRLNLTATGVKTDSDGHILTDERLRTNVPHIFALGDINGLFPLRHKANFEAYVLSDALYGDKGLKMDYDKVPMAAFTHPQVASVGLTEAQARKRHGDKVQVVRERYSDVIAGVSMGYSKRREDDGFAKVIVNEQRQIIGAHVVGQNAAIIAQHFAYAMSADPQEKQPMLTSVDIIDRAMTIHPSFSELAAWSLGQLPGAIQV